MSVPHFIYFLYIHRVAKLTQETMERNKPIVENDNDGDSSEAECDESDTDNEQVCTLDPVTNQTMTDPVKNSICGHSYERSSITRLMQKPGMLCPAVGCAVPLKDAEMFEDVALKEYLANNKK